ncbi:hypothetical protein H4S06_005491 [Coemansia sp. BCRC 34490]|nr:hypothetical protein H4S06_005491 [Coemansia sp. BCRC 34490]
MDHLQKDRILVLGRSTVDKNGLVQSIVSPSSANAPALPSAVPSDSCKVKWCMETRYYCAELEFWIDTTEQLTEPEQKYMHDWLEDPDCHNDDDDELLDTQDGAEKVGVSGSQSVIPVDESMAQLQEHLSDVVDAVVFVFDPSDPESFVDILPWARYGRLYQPGVLLCVAATGPITGTRSDPGPEPCDIDRSEVEKEKWFGWCVVNGWEWVDLTDTDPDTEYTVGRIGEALASNEWATMTMKQQQQQHPQRQAPAPSNPETQNSQNGSETTHRSDTTMSEKDEARPLGDKEQEEWDLFESVAQSVDPERVETLRKLIFASGGFGQGSDLPHSSRIATSNEGVLETDNDAGDMAAVHARLARFREEISHLDKDQARAKAAELAMAFAGETP